jgi:hypothetical protein
MLSRTSNAIVTAANCFFMVAILTGISGCPHY